MDADLGSWSWIVRHSTFCCLLELFAPIVSIMIYIETTADSTLVGTQPRIMCWTRAHGAQMSFSTYRSGGNLVLILDFSISVLRQLLLSFVRIVA